MCTAGIATEQPVKTKLVTQMGTQIHAGANYRRAVELIQSGVIGPVRDVHVWLGANFSGPAEPASASQPDAPTDTPPVPPTLDWDLWLGPAPHRPYHSAYSPFAWRYWWAFANGQLGVDPVDERLLGLTPPHPSDGVARRIPGPAGIGR